MEQTQASGSDLQSPDGDVHVPSYDRTLDLDIVAELGQTGRAASHTCVEPRVRQLRGGKPFSQKQSSVIPPSPTQFHRAAVA